jgi:hypothetical protein
MSFVDYEIHPPADYVLGYNGKREESLPLQIYEMRTENVIEI